MVIDPSATYVSLKADGQSAQLEGASAFWSLPESDLNAIGKDWLVSEFTCSADWPNWEMHPEGDEMVYLLEGHVCLLLDMPQGRQEVPIKGRGAVLVPKGVWHTARVLAPSRMFHITMGQGTQSRPA